MTKAGGELFSNELLILLPDTGCLHCLAQESLGLILNQQWPRWVLVPGGHKELDMTERLNVLGVIPISP